MKLTKEMLREAERVAGLRFTKKERELMLKGLNGRLERIKELRKTPLDSRTAPAFVFRTEPPGRVPAKEKRVFRPTRVRARRVPKDLEELAFWPVTDLAALLRRRKVTSLALTKMYLARLKRFGPKLECVVTLTEELALKQARRADRELRAGRRRGPLHGVPWGAKDLLAVRGYPTTWGAMPYKDQTFDYDATVVERLEEAGAVLVAKLTLGALAMGDLWFGGKTRNPWNAEQGSSGSSAGSAAATAAGLVGFAIGTETYGSIVSPSTICGVTGLRPTFGRVSRSGAMPLSWTMDKIGPICRSVEDCALVLDAIHGMDGKDASAVDRAFNWDVGRDVGSLRIGYVKKDFDAKRKDAEWRALDLATVRALRTMGFKLTPIRLPDMPLEAMGTVIGVEAAAVFDELTRSNRDDLMVGQGEHHWPNILRQARLFPAVEYVQAQRMRSLAIDEMDRLMQRVDVYVAPSWEGANMLLTNLTGHPSVSIPNGFRKNGTPTGLTFNGRLYDEATLLSVAKTYQDATGFHLERPGAFHRIP